MSENFYEYLQDQLHAIREEGLYKEERIITSPQNAQISLKAQANVINFCANNYLGLANHPMLIEAAHKALDTYGYGMASVRFICGTQTPHKALEAKMSAFLDKEDTILYSSCFDANAGLFETLLNEQDAIISDSLNHASIIDGVRLCKAQRFRYENNNMADLETQLKAAQKARFRLIATDGIFSMDGTIANLPAICELAEKYDALVMVDDSHAVGFMGPKGQGTPHHHGVEKYVDILTGTFGKALGGASGGYTSGKKAVVDYLRQRSRPYLFSNTLAPLITQTTLTALDLIQQQDHFRATLFKNAAFFRAGLLKQGFELIPGEHPIIPVMIGDAALATQFATALLSEGIYVVGFSYPVVPKGRARIRTQMSAAHTQPQLEQALAAFTKIGRQLKIIA